MIRGVWSHVYDGNHLNYLMVTAPLPHNAGLGHNQRCHYGWSRAPPRPTMNPSSGSQSHLDTIETAPTPTDLNILNGGLLINDARDAYSSPVNSQFNWGTKICAANLSFWALFYFLFPCLKMKNISSNKSEAIQYLFWWFWFWGVVESKWKSISLNCQLGLSRAMITWRISIFSS